MVRTIIHIDEEKCNGCGKCASVCHEGAIDMVDGKAKLAREHFCDGFGDCLSGCPTGAITFEEREAPAYDEKAVMEAKDKKVKPASPKCPGSTVRKISRVDELKSIERLSESLLQNWPIQIKLAPIQAEYYNNAELLIAADCTAYAYAAFHSTFVKDKTVLIGCPKLDAVDYGEKLAEIIANNPVKKISVVRMEVPCCGGMEMAVKRAIQASGKALPSEVFTISIQGEII